MGITLALYFRKNKRAKLTRLINASPPMTPPTIAPALFEVEEVERAGAKEVPEGGAENVDEKDAENDDLVDGDEDDVEVGITAIEAVDTAESDIRLSVVVTGAAVVNTASRWSVIGDAPQAM
jgi:hypothetical protein